MRSYHPLIRNFWHIQCLLEKLTPIFWIHGLTFLNVIWFLFSKKWRLLSDLDLESKFFLRVTSSTFWVWEGLQHICELVNIFADEKAFNRWILSWGYQMFHKRTSQSNFLLWCAIFQEFVTSLATKSCCLDLLFLPVFLSHFLFKTPRRLGLRPRGIIRNWMLPKRIS